MPGKGTTALIDELREQGYDCGPAYLSFLLREHEIPRPPQGPAGAFVWEPMHEAALRAALARRGRAPSNYGKGVPQASGCAQ